MVSYLDLTHFSKLFNFFDKVWFDSKLSMHNYEVTSMILLV